MLAKVKAEAAEKLRAHAAVAYAFPIRFEGGLAAPTFSAEPGLQMPDGGQPTGRDVHRDAGLIAVDLPRYPEPAIEPVLDPMAGFGVVEPRGRRRRQAAHDAVRVLRRRQRLRDAAGRRGGRPVRREGDCHEPGVLRIGDHAVHINPDGSAGLNYMGKMEQRFRTV